MATTKFKPSKTTNRAQIESAATKGNVKDMHATLTTLHERIQQLEEWAKNQ